MADRPTPDDLLRMIRYPEGQDTSRMDLSMPPADPGPLMNTIRQAGEVVKRYQDFPLSFKPKKGGGMIYGKWRF